MRTRSLPLIAALLLPACAADTVPDEIEDGVAVAEGKEDDFFSASAYEYVLEGRTAVTLEADLVGAADEVVKARVKELIGYKQIAIAWFLTQYFSEKEEDAANKEFGGFGGLAKGGGWEDLEVTPIDDVTYEFTFKQIIAGRKDLIDRLPLSDGPAGRRYFDLEIGKPSNQEMAELETNAEWYRNPPWDEWNPATVSADRKETLTLRIEREKASTDAWFDFPAMLADGQLTIDVHFGWDYHSEYHVKHARALFDWLKGRGFTAPVASFDQLDRTSGPFTRTIDASGREITVAVRIYYGKAGTDTDPDTAAGGRQLEDDMRASLADRDAVVYSGHSGPFYGFALANWRKTTEGDLDDSEMASVTMPSRYQVVFAEGCDTYHIGEALRSNPAKPGGSLLDVITTTSFSNASTPAAVEDFLTRLTEVDSHGHHRPRTMLSLLDDLDSNSYWFHTMYGIHGIDDNPALHPYADVGALCQECTSYQQCGGIGNLCIGVGDSGRRCAAACTDDRGCPDGYACRAVASSSSATIYDHACVPVDMTCR